MLHHGMNPSQLSARGISTVRSIVPLDEKEARDAESIDLSIAENCLLNEEMSALCKSAVNDKLTSQHFAPSHGLECHPNLLESLADHFNTYFNPCIPVHRSHLATGPGAASCLDALLYNICDAGDGVLIPGPYWGGFALFLLWNHSMMGERLNVHASTDANIGPSTFLEDFDSQLGSRSSVRPVVVNVESLTETFRNCPDLIPALAAAMDQSSCKIKALILTNPHNPFGQCYPQEVLEACIKFCQYRNIHFISHEVYTRAAFTCADITDPAPFISALTLDVGELGCDLSRIHTVWSISKDFGASDFRVGCTVSQHNPELIYRLNLASTQVSSVSALFTTALLSSPKLGFFIMLNSVRLAESYVLITTFFTQHRIRYIPVNAGLTIFAKLAPGAKTWDDEKRMIETLKRAGVVVCPGRKCLGIEQEKGWARLSFSVERSRLREALRRIELALGLR